MYTNKGNLQKYIMIDIDASFDTQVENWISAAERYINQYVGRPDGFETGADETRYFDGNGKREIDIDEFISITSVEYLESNGEDVGWTLTEGLESDYITYPYNKTPYYRLKLVTSSEIGAWYKGKKRLKVTGKFGHSSSVPKDIELVATMLISNVIEKGLKGGKVTSESLGDYSISFEDIQQSASLLNVKNILDQYKLFNL